MYGKADEYFIHQTIDTVDHVYTSDPRFQDRLVFNAHGRPGESLIMVGLGAYPNTNCMDGYVLAYDRGVQYNVRASRQLATDREHMHCAPFHFEVVEPLRTWRLWLDENPHGVAFDLTFRGRTAPLEHRPMFLRGEGAEVWHQIHLQQSGHYEGRLSIGGRDIDVGGWWGDRDRSWGVRGPLPGTRAARQGREGRRWEGYAWMTGQFDDFALEAWCIEPFHFDGTISYANDHHVGPRFVHWRHEVLERDKRGIETEVLNILLDTDGNEHEVLTRKLFGPYLAGFTFHDGQGYGVWRGEHLVEGDRWDLRDPKVVDEVRQKTGGLCENLAEYRYSGKTGYGVYESALMG